MRIPAAIDHLAQERRRGLAEIERARKQHRTTAALLRRMARLTRLQLEAQVAAAAKTKPRRSRARRAPEEGPSLFNAEEGRGTPASSGRG